MPYPGKKIAAEPVLSAVTDQADRQVSAAIVEACRAGDRDAFRALYDQHKDKVYSIALYFFHGDAGLAGDITQQVFLKLMTSIKHFRGDSEFSTWLYRMVVNACVDSSRKHKAAPTTLDPAIIDTFSTRASQEEDLARAQAETTVRAAVSSLPPQFRMAILLRHFEDFSYGQIATALNCSLGTVASKLARGHKLLAERLKGIVGASR